MSGKGKRKRENIIWTTGSDVPQRKGVALWDFSEPDRNEACRTPASPSKELQRAEYFEELRNVYAQTCAEVLGLQTPPPDSMDRWLLEQLAQPRGGHPDSRTLLECPVGARLSPGKPEAGVVLCAAAEIITTGLPRQGEPRPPGLGCIFLAATPSPMTTTPPPRLPGDRLHWKVLPRLRPGGQPDQFVQEALHPKSGTKEPAESKPSRKQRRTT
ncbi:hypothetical protein AK812_SmicGene45369 [Symbiodinium microadriaticum]|uniref:Uncharacterized protein n=1 Tax=Symbiodinium microadriaticum TaxID=2951 RepID=A0A1Q9BW91_SYMMI|nr:hypothetical protein AK812_SmicGene45369 [Symbiodinium microadriaticum]